jgi:hypothetical protein
VVVNRFRIYETKTAFFVFMLRSGFRGGCLTVFRIYRETLSLRAFSLRHFSWLEVACDQRVVPGHAQARGERCRSVSIGLELPRRWALCTTSLTNDQTTRHRRALRCRPVKPPPDAA